MHRHPCRRVRASRDEGRAFPGGKRLQSMGMPPCG
jgi:hypothetical protein